MPVTSYSRTPASNNAAPPNGAPEGMTPGSVNDTMRQLMTDTVNEAAKGQARVLGTVAGADTITAVMSPSLDAYSAGMIVVFTPASTNTTAVTLNINALGALDVQRQNAAALAAGDLVAGVPAVLVLDSGADDWILLNPMSFATLNVSSSLTYGGVEVGYRTLPYRLGGASFSVAQSDNGKAIYCAVGGVTVTLPALTDGTMITIMNSNNASNITLSPSGVTLTWYNGSGTISTGNRTLAGGGVATIHYASGTWNVWGTGLT